MIGVAHGAGSAASPRVPVRALDLCGAGGDNSWMPIRYADLKIAEADLHRAVAELLDVALLAPAVWTTFPAGWGRLPRATSGRLRGAGLKAGFPDILIFYNGRCIGIELKAPGGKLSKAQIEMFPRLEMAGVDVYISDNIADVLGILRQENLPVRKMEVAA